MLAQGSGSPGRPVDARIDNNKKLEKEGFVKKERGESYQLTEKGKRAAKEAEDVPF
jgi:predicted transcriptional regulator